MSGSSGTAAGTPVGTPISSLQPATAASPADQLIILQLNTAVTPPALVPRLVPVSVLGAAVGMTAAQFAAALTTAIAAWPEAEPASAGIAWNNEGVLQLS